MSWSPRHFIRDLDRAFRDIDAKFEFLQQVDKLIHAEADSLETSVYKLLPALRTLCEADEIGFIFSQGGRNIFFKVADDSSVTQTAISDIAEQAIEATANGEVAFRALEDSGVTLLAAPIRLEHQPVFGILLLTTVNIPPNASALSDEATRRYIGQVAEQLGFLISTLIDRRWRQIQVSATTAFVSKSMSFNKALNEILGLILQELQNSHPLKLCPAPLVQLLVRKADVAHLTIAATVGATSPIPASMPSETDIGKVVSLSDSICGLFVQAWEEERIPLLVVNPRMDHQILYKAFDGRELPQTELVIPLENGSGLIGVLNLEHSSPNAFSDVHIFYLKRMAAFISPFIETMMRAIDELRIKDVSLLYTMYGFLVRLNATYVHKTSQQIPQIARRLDRLRKRLVDNTDGLKELADQAYAVFEGYVTLSKGFMKAAPDYLQKGKVPLGETINTAMKEFDPRHRTIRDVETRIEGLDNPVYVYASMLLSEHVYNLITNARDAIAEYRKKKQDTKHEPGLIIICCSRKPNQDHEGRQIPGSRIVVRIEDNGTGTTAEFQKNGLGKFGATTKGHKGNGFGVAAAKEYIESLDGNFACGNRDDARGFFVEFFLEEFDSQRHDNGRKAS